MATDYGEKERAFIDGLKEETGRDLAEWMAAISGQDLAHRNDIIDWLRQQGVMFSNASWLERIHHNGGRPVYADNPTAIRQPASKNPDAPVEEPPSAPQPRPVAARPVLVKSDGDLDALLAKAKAYRPLAQALIAQVKARRPNARFEPRTTFIAIADPAVFAALGIGPKELRLHLALGEHPFDDMAKKAVPGAGLGRADTLSHMIVLADARQIDARLLDLVAAAAVRVNGK